ncbi:hypothetical protein ACFCVO_19055 [Agromyces sp. NPDC056379]|uniref:hypothetical protein n=1 Tax=unclassified Agromyces TaxID=2639701 RepID=UPI0035E15F50
MIRRLATNPAAVALVALLVLCIVGTVWGVQLNVADQGITTMGEPTEQQEWQARILRLASFVPTVATFVGVAALLGVLVIASASRSRTAPSRLEEPT